MQQIDELLEKAERFASETRWKEAIAVTRQAVEIEPNNVKVLDKFGWYLSRDKQHDEAIQVYLSLTTLVPNNAKYFYTLGYQYYDKEQYAEAIPWFQKALELNPNYIVVLYRQGYAYLQTRNQKSAQECFNQCVRAWQALSNEDTKARESKSYSDACFQLGKILSGSSQWQRAINAFAESCQYDGSDENKLYNLGKALIKEARYKEAREVLEKANQIAPRKHYIQTYLAKAYEGLELYAGAEQIYKTIPTRVKDTFPYIYEYEAQLYINNNQYMRVIQLLAPATRHPNVKGLHNWHNVFMLLGQAFEQEGKLPNAYEAYQNANDWYNKSQNKDSQAALKAKDDVAKIAHAENIDLHNVENVSVEPSRYKGRIKRFNFDRGFGFIEHSNGDDVFVHIKSIDNQDKVNEGILVEYQVEDSDKGLRAIKVRILDDGA